MEERATQNNTFIPAQSFQPKPWKHQRSHPLDKIISDLSKGTQTRSQLRKFCAFNAFLSTLEPLNHKEALEDADWIVAMQEELHEFERNKVWHLEPKPKNQKVIGLKWVYRNKLDEHGTIVRNKARLVVKGYNQQEGIDFEETFAPEDVYVEQPPGFEDPNFPNHVFKLDKALSLCKISIGSKGIASNSRQKDSTILKRDGRLVSVLSKSDSFDLRGYADADYAGDLVNRKSTSGMVQFLGSCMVSWSSKKQNTVALSTVEAEYVAAAACCSQLLWIKQQLRDYGIILECVPIHCDNTSAICIFKDPVQHSKVKHIHVRHHF
ncbi:uncharacterized protein LOC110731177 [Chenopodium quinoa]|uniref:uncharacterized protein LOC110731177 n=1 Tax=Chenopodium quinoa TaxID=63459 RepID=UPI000B798047|nr:uncharacterized protein LOC110731177 [Chenopodium quinoa]